MAIKITREELIREYLLYGLSKAEAEECADSELIHRAKYEKYGSSYIKHIQKKAPEYNWQIYNKKKLNEFQIKRKREKLLLQQSIAEKKNKSAGRKYNNAHPVIDPNGVYYKTTGEMCKAWGTMLPTYCNRLAKGWTMLEALKGKSKIMLHRRKYEF